MPLTGYILALVCFIAALYALIKIFRNNAKLKASGPVFPYLSAGKKELLQDNLLVGYSFEKFVVGRFDRKRFVLEHWRSDKLKDGQGIQPTSYPDLFYTMNENGKQLCFAVECKWRPAVENDAVSWATYQQIDSYKEFQREQKIPVFVVIGLGGSPESPEQLFVVPLSKIARHMETVTADFLRDYQKTNTYQNFQFDTNSMMLS